MWKPGQSGNPKGRPKQSTQVLKVRQMVDDYAVEAAATLIEIMQAGGKDALSAAKEILRLAGCSPEINIAVTDTANLITHASAAEIERQLIDEPDPELEN